jgi:hypothetical protein
VVVEHDCQGGEIDQYLIKPISDQLSEPAKTRWRKAERRLVIFAVGPPSHQGMADAIKRTPKTGAVPEDKTESGNPKLMTLIR